MLPKRYKAPIAFICSPYRGNIAANRQAAKRYSRYIVDNTDFIPIAPHLLFPQFMNDNDPDQRKKALDYNKSLIRLAKIFYICGNHISCGMKEEIAFATSLSIPMTTLNSVRTVEEIIEKEDIHV